MRVRNVRRGVIAALGLLVVIWTTRADIEGQSTSWSNQDIGSPAIAGSATSTPSGFTITAGGRNIWGRSDQFHFVYQQVSGDVDLRARVDSISYTTSGAKAGVMIRGSLAAGAAHGFALASPAGTAFDRRKKKGGVSTHTAGASGAAPQWVRLVRQGSTVSAYTSTDGAGWTPIGSDTIQLPTVVYVGLAVTSHDVSAATTAFISQIGVQPLALPAGQQGADVGSPAIAGAATFANGAYTIHAGGADIWGTADQFHYVYQPVTGAIDVSVRIASLSYAHQWSKAGVMIRETLSADSAQAFALVSAGSGYAFHRRPVTGATTVGTDGGTGVAPGWLRLTRSGSLFTAYRSNDGTNWTPIGSDSIPMSDAVYVGIAVTSHNVRVPTDVVADYLTVGGSTAPNQPPSASVTSPAPGATFTAPATIAISAAASDPENQLAKVEFYAGTTLLGSATAAPYSFTWSNVAAGTYSLTAVAYDAEGLSTGSSAVTVTVTASNQPPSVSLTSPAAGATFTAPASITMAATASDADGSVARVDFYNGSTLLGSATAAPYAFTWSNVAAGTYALQATAVDNAGAGGSSATATVTVTAPANQTPTATLTAPANGATFTAPASITMTATASDADGTVARVDFYNGTTLLGSDTTAPYAFTWSSVAAGTYALKATAVDNAGASGSSATVTVTVTAPATQVPTVTLTAPANGASFTAPATVSLAASASDADGTVARVDFYSGSTLLGTDASEPYTFTWSNVAAGTYALKATAVDNAGASGSSATATITVSGAASGLVSAYGLNEGTGTIVSDSAGSAPGTVTGATWVPGRYGQALSFDGSDQVVLADTDLPGSFTVMGWLQTRSLYTNGCASFVMKAFDYGLEVCSGQLWASVGTGTGWTSTVKYPWPAADLNVWKHVALTYDGTAIRLYVEGVQVGSGTGAHGTNNNQLIFGRWTPASEYWDGLIDEVRIYNRTLTQAEIQTDRAAPIGGGNQAPTATLTAPATGATYTAPASITLTVTAADADGTVARVDFYNGTTLLGSDTTAPYAFTWSSVAAGTYALKATAVDNAGASGSSSVASVTVTGVNQPPTVSIASPANDATFSAPASIAITANAADPENELTRVEFFNGTTLLGTDTAAPYSFTWSSVPAGSYSLTARAYDAGGLSTTSAAVSVTVNATTGSPTGVVFGASADHAAVTSYRLDVFATGADVNTAIPVATMNAGKPVPDVNNDITVSAPSFFSALAPGAYQLTVSAINSAGVGRSVPLSFTR